MKSAVMLSLALILSLFQTSCSKEIEPKNKKLILLLTVDSLRADHLGTYGFPKDISPGIDLFASQATLFKNAFTTCSWTKPSLVSMLTGMTPSEHLVISSALKIHLDVIKQKADTDQRKSLFKGLMDHFDRTTKIPKDLPLFYEYLKGFKKAAFLNNPHLHTHFGFNRGWDHYTYYPPKAYQQRRIFTNTPLMNEHILDYIDENRGENLFIWAHYNDVHYPYGPAKKYLPEFYTGSGIDLDKYNMNFHKYLMERARTDEKTNTILSSLYKAGVKQFDESMGMFFQGLKERNKYDPALIILTSDHGEEFMEHKEVGHGQNLFNSTLWIPLIIKRPGQQETEKREENVSIKDIGPSILSFTGDLEGSPFNLENLLTGTYSSPSEEMVVSKLISLSLNHYSSIIYKDHKLIIDILNMKKTLYSIKAGNMEKEIPETNPGYDGLTKKLENALLKKITTYDFFSPIEKKALGESQSPEVKKELMEQLRSLGYTQ